MQKNSRSGSALLITVLAVVVIAVAALAYYFDWLPFGRGGENIYVDKAVVKRGDLMVTVTEDGTLESAANVEVKCQVAGGSSILWIIKDGTEVKKGDKIVELESSLLEDQIIAQQNVLETAKATKIQAENDFSVAKISVKEYEEGNFKKELQEAETQVTIALENLRNAENSLEHSQKMFRKGYLSKLELESQEFAVKRSQLELDSANSAKEVLVKYTKAKTLEDLHSKVATAEAKMNSEIRSYQLEENKLEKLISQKDNCIIYAPQDGMVVYANSKSRWGQQTAQIEEGAAVRERQAIIKLPDLTKMQVNVKVHESKVELLEPGLPASIRVQGKRLNGTVRSVANQPEQGSFMAAKVQEYATIIGIDGEQEGLKPGMTAEAEILVARETNVIKVPTTAVVEKNGKYLVWVDKNGDYEKRELEIGLTDDNYVVAKSGIAEGETVLINPRAYVEEARSDGSDSEDKADGELSKFGDPSKIKAPSGDSMKAKSNSKGRGGPPSGAKGKGGSGGYPKSDGGGGSRPKMDPKEMFKKMDKNGDGKVAGDEISEQMKGRTSIFDKDNDGAISEKEWTDTMKSFSRK